ncbi:SusC/RagA family TonB-linked outer membrane protein [Niabella sp. CC-SYL272]|uniref:SusC/RagA family TonB-linked outer membrane protein n=1 Tax=Niabella agricola TaxID=2891571 RepID=UPI001F1CE072|nr:SusC/RagA family TonB-linked outer membrane protein [Niabella agricola]MCF3107714.1 SusC/RagA family TonB-linked outer membrane protein [Niabella agricola]
MNYKKTGVVLFALFAFLPLLLNAQPAPEITVKAIVYGAGNLPLAAARVNAVTDDAAAVTTDASGAFTIVVPEHTELAIAAAGYKTRYVKAVLGMREIILDEAADVPVLFGKKQKEDLITGVEVVNVQALMKKNYFTYSLDGMEALVPGYNGNSLWGMGSYLTLVDGIPRDANNVMPTEIDQITFLKGAAAVALYGTQAARGVIMITTKRGEANTRKTSITVNAGVNVAKSFPRYLGAAEYMTLYNEARVNDGMTPLYSPSDIYNFASGNNPYRYPDLNFYNPRYIKKTYNRYDATAEISGGNERARYYTNINYYTGGSFLNFGEGKNNDRTSRFSVRGNIDVNINPFIYSKIDASATFYDDRSPNAAFWQGAATVRPNRYAPLIPLSFLEKEDEASWALIRNSNYIIDGTYFFGGTQLDQTNPFAAMYGAGYSQFVSRQFQFNTSAGADLRNLLKGLKFQTDFAIDYRTAYSQSYNNTYATYAPVWNNYSGKDLITSLTKYGEDASSGVQNVNGTTYRQTLALSGYFSYDDILAGDHHLTGLLVANGFQQTTSGVYHALGSVNLGLQLGYSYRNKYMFDFSGALVHSAKLPEGKRKAFSPTVSLGWRISRENFMKAATAVVDDLKLVASAGRINTDLDIPNYYMYAGYYRLDDNSPWWGWDGGGYSGRVTEAKGGANPGMTYPRLENLSAGFEGSFFKTFLKLQGSFFANKMKNMLVSATTMASVIDPSWFVAGNSVFGAAVNRDAELRTGFDFGATFNKKISAMHWTWGINGTYYTTKAVKRTEIANEPYQYRQGKVLDGIWGYETLGFFQDAGDISRSPVQSLGAQVKPGDLKYRDQNGDGVINTNDQVLLGRGGWYGAPLTIGTHLTVQWKKLSLFALGVGRYGADGVKNGSYYWIGGEDKYSVVVRNRWTPETAATATYPRLTTQSKANNFVTSDFWMYKDNRFDLARVQLSYDLSDAVKQGHFVKELGLYISGANLLTISKERALMEMNIGSAPQARFYNLGVKALF